MKLKHARARYVIAYRCPHCRKMQYREACEMTAIGVSRVCGHFGRARKYLVRPPKPIRVA